MINSLQINRPDELPPKNLFDSKVFYQCSEVSRAECMVTQTLLLQADR